MHFQTDYAGNLTQDTLITRTSILIFLGEKHKNDHRLLWNCVVKNNQKPSKRLYDWIILEKGRETDGRISRSQDLKLLAY